ncbi:MAG: hypothetical protein ABI781_01840 [Burkholderiales bacterium]
MMVFFMRTLLFVSLVARTRWLRLPRTGFGFSARALRTLTRNEKRIVQPICITTRCVRAKQDNSYTGPRNRGSTTRDDRCLMSLYGVRTAAFGRVTMTVLSDVFGSLRSMTQLQLLLAFIACIGYAFAQGSLLAFRGRRAAWIAAALAAIGFAFESDDWTHATMLLGFAIAGMGSFVAVVWLTSRALGIDHGDVSLQAVETEPAPLQPNPARTRATPPSAPAHSV